MPGKLHRSFRGKQSWNWNGSSAFAEETNRAKADGLPWNNGLRGGGRKAAPPREFSYASADTLASESLCLVRILDRLGRRRSETQGRQDRRAGWQSPPLRHLSGLRISTVILTLIAPWSAASALRASPHLAGTCRYRSHLCGRRHSHLGTLHPRRQLERKNHGKGRTSAHTNRALRVCAPSDLYRHSAFGNRYRAGGGPVASRGGDPVDCHRIHHESQTRRSLHDRRVRRRLRSVQAINRVPPPPVVNL